jgi:hypothetical protein
MLSHMTITEHITNQFTSHHKHIKFDLICNEHVVDSPTNKKIIH